MSDTVPPPDGAAPDDALDDPTIEARRAVEAVLLAATEPVAPTILAQWLEIPASRVELLCQGLAAEYEAQRRGFVLRRVAGGWRYQTHPDLAAYVERAVLEGQQARLSAAAMETLAIVAYKQPVSRAQLSAIRGVSVDAVLRTLFQRGYVAEVGRDPGPGQAVLYGTTRLFLEQLGLDTLSDLPSLGDFVPPAEVMEILEHTLQREAPGHLPGIGGDDATIGDGDGAAGDGPTVGDDATIGDGATAGADGVTDPAHD